MLAPTTFACYLCSEYSDTKTNTLVSYEGPDQYEVAVGITEHSYFRKWVKCSNCGLILSIYSRSNSALDILYEKLYRKVGSVPWRNQSTEQTFDLVRKLPPENSETVERVTFIKEKISNYQEMNLFPQKMKYRLLDVGGATGSFAFEFKDKHWDVHIIDPDPSGDFLEKYGVNFNCGYLSAKSYEIRFDLVSLIFVLEHVGDPKKIIHEISELMCEGALLYIEVPDEIAFIKKASSDDIFNSCHLFMFGPMSLGNLLRQSGFEILSLERSQTKRGHFALTCIAKLKT